MPFFMSSKASSRSTSIVSSASSIKTPKMSSAEAYWSDPVVGAGFLGAATPSAIYSRSSSPAPSKKADKPKVSAAEQYWSSASTGAGLPVFAAPSTPAVKKSKKLSAAEQYWCHDPVVSFGFGPAVAQPLAQRI